MKAIRIAAWIVLALAALVVVASLPVESSFASRAKKVQLIEPSQAAALFGDEGTMIGSPQEMIIDDPKAMLPGKGPEGSVLVNNTYLKEHGIYPLQLKTVGFFAHWVRLGSFGAMLAGGAALLLVRRRGAAR